MEATFYRMEWGTYAYSVLRQTDIKQDAAHEPECSHVKRFCETNYLKSLVHFSPVTYQCTVDCGIRKRVECKVWGVKKVEC